MNVGYVYHEDYLKHETGPHPENPGRLTAIMNGLKQSGMINTLTRIEPVPAAVDQIKYIHFPEYIRLVPIYLYINL